jgi:hypothetical protein
MSDTIRQLLRYKYPDRPPSDSERDFFRANPRVGGYAAPDDSVVLNPYSPLTPQEQWHVGVNEGARIDMRQSGDVFRFPLTQGQKSQFAGTPYAKGGQMARHSVVARILSGDPSAGDSTPEQQAAAMRVAARAMYPIGPE